jgi:hypothetical protein
MKNLEYINNYDKMIRARIHNKWGFGRLYRWLSVRLLHIGEIVLVNHILSLAHKEGVNYSMQTIYRVAREQGFEVKASYLTTSPNFTLSLCKQNRVKQSILESKNGLAGISPILCQ